MNKRHITTQWETNLCTDFGDIEYNQIANVLMPFQQFNQSRLAPAIKKNNVTEDENIMQDNYGVWCWRVFGIPNIRLSIIYILYSIHRSSAYTYLMCRMRGSICYRTTSCNLHDVPSTTSLCAYWLSMPSRVSMNDGSTCTKAPTQDAVVNLLTWSKSMWLWFWRLNPRNKTTYQLG